MTVCIVEFETFVTGLAYVAPVGQAAPPSNAGIPVIVWVFVGVFVTALIMAILFNAVILRKWLALRMAGVSATLIDVAVLPVRGIPTSVIVNAALELSGTGVSVTIQRMAQLYVANKSRIQNASDLVELYRLEPTRDDSA